MRYLLMIYDNPDSRAVFAQDPELGREIEAVLAQLTESGELLGGEALADPSETRVVRVVDGAAVVTDGPLAEAKEHFGGWLLVDVETPERAAEIAALWPSSRSAPMEVRRLMDPGGAEM